MSDQPEGTAWDPAKRVCMNCGEYKRRVEDGWCIGCTHPAPKPIEWGIGNRPWTAEERDEWNAMLRELETQP